jgi:hypothetical protein
MKRILLLAVLVPLLAGCTNLAIVDVDDPTPEPSVTPSHFVVDLGAGVKLAVLGEDSTWSTRDEYRCGRTAPAPRRP